MRSWPRLHTYSRYSAGILTEAVYVAALAAAAVLVVVIALAIFR
jgi:hypothetical protein